jgi:hypothetical protein
MNTFRKREKHGQSQLLPIVSHDRRLYSNCEQQSHVAASVDAGYMLMRVTVVVLLLWYVLYYTYLNI